MFFLPTQFYKNMNLELFLKSAHGLIIIFLKHNYEKPVIFYYFKKAT